ncbi:autotransporter outer membrane beta-barrel domain-containing protein [Nitrosospira multiformis]|uniref:autotransporter outer membrane beta-barrel domain-containing protein n=1 Tax=Nitrosospira multiformis TaxID=1231 RepID=UPI0008960A0A|nr:autotransporter domain-containing protein [Nitrosospira multiformis]SDZ88624.1 outer membrane autotransporter barrel domain-containing protein [Nitrosospira multiformis]
MKKKPGFTLFDLQLVILGSALSAVSPKPYAQLLPWDPASNLVFNGSLGSGEVVELTSVTGDFSGSLGTGPGQVQWTGSGGFLSNDSNRIVNIGGSGGTLTWGSGNFVPSGEALILGTSSANMLDFQNGIDLGGVIPTIQVQGGSIEGHARINGTLSGTGGLQVIGTGNDMLELTGANTYLGETFVNSSTLVVSADNNMGASMGWLRLSNGTLRNTASFTMTRGVLLDFGGGTFHTDANLEVAGPILSMFGMGNLTKTGSAQLILSGNNFYFGDTVISAGTLQVGNGGITGSITGNVINNGTLAFNRSDDTSYGGVVSGTGGLIKLGPGRLTLTGENTYIGGTAIAAGALQIGNGGTTGSIAGNVTNNGTLAFNRSNDMSYGGVVSGTGALNKLGAGRLTLTGENTYTGSTTIDAGALQIGNGGTTGSIAGNVTNNGTLAFNRSNDMSYGGVVSGTGALNKLGAGRLTLTGENTYTGGTTIDAGALQIGNGGTIGSIVGDVNNFGGILEFNRSNNLGYSGAISGFGTIVKDGAGTLELTGNSGGFVGSILVNSGTLAVNGILGGVVNVDADARLQGNGMIGTGIVAGTVAPGNSIGTLGVSGNYTQLPGSVYEVEIDPAGNSDRIAVAGTANLHGGTVAVTPGVGTYSASTRYTILTAAGGRTGAFDALTLTRTLPFLDMGLSYDPNNVYLDANPLAFCAVTVTANQCAAGQSVESLGSGHSLYDTITGLPDRDAARRAFDSLSGELHASAKGVMIEDSRFLREAVNDRLRQSFSWPGVTVSRASGQTLQENRATGHAFWTRAFGSFGHRSGDMNAARINRNIGGFFMGGDTLVADLLRLGIAGGYSNSSFNVNERFSTGSSDNYHVTAYGGTRWHALGLRFGGGYTWHDFETNRNILFPGFNNQAKGDYRGRTGQVFGELGYELPFKNVSLEPFAGVAYVNLATKGFQERGGIAALSSSRDNEGVTYSTVGMNAASMFSTAGGTTTRLRGSLGWRHAFDSVPTRSSLAFSGGSAFGIAGTPIAKDAMIIGAGLDASVGKNAILGIAYTGQVFSNVVDNGVRANLDWRF